MPPACLLVAALAGSAVAQPTTTSITPQISSVIEPTDSDVPDGLLQLGVNVSAIPGLTSIVDVDADRAATATKRSTPCKRAASCSMACDALAVLSQNQAEVRPYCVFVPPTAAHVVIAVLLNRLTGCPFAAKSAGHSAYRGASNVLSGMTISFANIDQLTLSADKSVLSVGPGNVWGTVYSYLDNYNLTVIGGRLYDIGVGGLTTGGGISYLSNLYGGACDNVESYDVVLASGVLVRASATQFSDLYWALRGGGNNFGLVVNFRLKT